MAVEVASHCITTLEKANFKKRLLYSTKLIYKDSIDKTYGRVLIPGNGVTGVKKNTSL